tara:strand:+ start:39426 stop:40175 length:750 start_codon:yes stop_codon:yes gene_type:complete
MFNFLRKNRHKLILQDNTKKYLLYAIGEIMLVVIGILIALQVSNWNEKRIERNQLTNYYERIHEELSNQVFYLKDRRASVEGLITLTRRSIELYNTNNPDSLYKLESTIGAIGTAWTPDYDFPVLEEFLGSEYFSKVSDLEIKEKLRDFKASIYSGEINTQFTISQYQTVIEPYIIKNFNYQNSAMPRYQDFLIQGGPKTKYSKFHNDLEFWNILSLKYENMNQTRISIMETEDSMNELIKVLGQKLNK